MTIRLPIVTNSSISTYRRCPREYEIAYVHGYRPAEDAEALRFGSAWHLGLEQLWLGRGLATTLEVATAPIADPYERAKLEVMLRGYEARWDVTGSLHAGVHTVVGVEREFRAPLVNPETGAASRTYELGGKLDVLLDNAIVEHKTTSEELGFGSPYWEALAISSQVSTYYAGARALGHEVRECIYDVARKPALRPLRATPEESRKYTKDGRLYASQRDTDETPEEYALRLAEAIAAEPDRHYQRGTVVRLEAEEREHARDVWLVTQSMREAQRLGAYPRNSDACRRYGRMCAYFGVCTGTTSLDSPAFVRSDAAHPELSPELQAAE